MRRHAPRSLGDALERQRRELAPASLLAAVQQAWPAAVGPAIARETRPLAERAGVVSVACGSAAWAHELELRGADLRERLLAALPERDRRRLHGLRFTTSRGGSP